MHEDAAGRVIHYLKAVGSNIDMSTEALVDQHEDSSDAFYAMLIHEFTEHGAHWWDGAIGEINRVAVVGYNPYGADEPDVRIVKVPRDTERARSLGRAEVASLSLLTETDPPPPFEIPAVERVEELAVEGVREGAFYFTLSPVRGLVVDSPDSLTTAEAQELGRATARIAMWEENIDPDRFTEEVDGRYGMRWDWHSIFSVLEFSDADYPSLSEASSRMRLLRNQYYPLHRSPGRDPQVIHGDLRLPNLALRGKTGQRAMCGVHDWGTARRGTRAEECRSLWEVGRGALEAANQEFSLCGRSLVDPQEVRFWFAARFLVALIHHLQNGIPVPKAYIRSQSVVQREFPEFDWTELPTIASPPTYAESGIGEGGAFRPNLNGVPGLHALHRPYP